MNQAAVDTLTKDVAIAVFRNISRQPNQPKAQEIYTRLLDCGDGCDPQEIIRRVGSWDQVGEKIQELSELKNTQRFLAMSPAEANAAIHQQLARFYARYKTDRNYGEPLSPAVRTAVLAKIDRMLPPAVAPEPSPVDSGNIGTGTPDAATVSGDEDGSINAKDYQISRLEREVKNEREKQTWMTILSAMVGMLIGAGAVYLFLVRALKNETDRLTDENKKLSRENDNLRNKPASEFRQPQEDFRRKASDYDRLVTELGTSDLIDAVRQLKQRAAATPPKPVPTVTPGEPSLESTATLENVLTQPLTPSIPEPTPEPTPARSAVFYCPPPDPNGQFDSSRQSDTLLPESAYRFSVDAENPALAAFRFEAEPGRVARFLTYRNYMIEPACDSENSYASGHTRIVMRKDGEATLENGVWRVKTKALIRYE